MEETIIDIDINLDDNNDGKIDENEKKDLSDKMENLSKFRQKLLETEKKIKLTDNPNIKKGLKKKIEDLNKLYNYVGIEKKITILKLKIDLEDLINDINIRIKGKRKKKKPIDSFLLDDYKILTLIKNKDINGLKKIALNDDGNRVLYRIIEMKEGLISNYEIVNILKIIAGKDGGEEVFYYINDMREIGLRDNDIVDILKSTKLKDFILMSFYKDMKEGGFSSEIIKDFLKVASGGEYGVMIFSKLNELREIGLTDKDIIDIFEKAIKTVKGYIIVKKIPILLQDGLDKDLIIFLLSRGLLFKHTGFKESFLRHYKIKKIIRKDIFLGNDFGKYEKDFIDEKDFKKFIEQILIKSSINISESINDIYNYYEEIDNSYPYGNIEDKPGIKTINGQIKIELKKYSTEELLSSLGNHSINYDTTFNLILRELDIRMNKLGKSDYFHMINENNHLTEKAKIFLKGQVIAGLSSRGRINKLNKLLQNNKEFFGIIDIIIEYKNNDIFTLETYLGLVIGLKNILKINKELQNYIYIKYFKTNKNKKFKKALVISLGLEGKKLSKDGIINSSQQEKEKLRNIREKYLINSKEFFSRNPKDMVSIYGGSTLANYEEDIVTYKRVGYKEVYNKRGITILEKDGIREIFINYNKNSNSMKDIISKLKINPVFIFYRGHNYETYEMIKRMKEELKENRDSIIIDGGCRNISVISKYKKIGIRNQIGSYTTTGKGAATMSLGMRLNSEYLRKEEEYINKDFTLKEIVMKVLPEGHYIKDFMKFPGGLMDIILDIALDTEVF